MASSGQGSVRAIRAIANPPNIGAPNGYTPVRSYLAAPVVFATSKVLGELCSATPTRAFHRAR